MVSKIWSYFMALVILFLLIGIGLQYYISKPIESKELICHKGKLLHKLDGGEDVYVKIKRISCEFEKGMLIIEEQS